MTKQRVNLVSGLKIEDAARGSRGLYTVAEVARYARMPAPRLNYWLYGDREHSALHPPTILRTEGKWLTFLEFVEVLAVRTLRNQYHLSFQKIRSAVNEARDAYGIEYPFANKDHRTFLIGSDLHIQLRGALAPVGLTGKDKKQQSFRPCIEPFMENLEFDDKKTAMAFIAYRYPILNEAGTGKSAIISPTANAALSATINIRMDPRYCFGEPVVEGTGYRADTLWRAALAENDMAKAAEYYEVNTHAVAAACNYCTEIGMVA
jgi:uncharacterized protein (DUF433 family)